MHINWRKSHLIPINEVNDMGDLALIMGGAIGNLPTV